MTYTKVILKGSLELVRSDIKSIECDGIPIYINYPEGYEVTGNTVHDRFIVTPPRQEIITPGTYNELGEEITPPVMGDYISHLVLPAGYDTSHFITSI
tara:strand:+ start:25069 stop:25362 length:294 start_codon:yes stop_codon:yes gene_type:complete